MNLPSTMEGRPDVPPVEELDLIHRWILHRTSQLSGEINTALEEFRFDVAADKLYHFFWHEYADWYIEFVKPQLQSEGIKRDSAVAVLLEVHDRILRMLHPFMPFVTEEVWQALPQRPGDGLVANGDGQTITLAKFPTVEVAWQDEQVVSAMALLQEVITTIRTVKSEWGVPPAREVKALVNGAESLTQDLLERHGSHVRRLAGLQSLQFADSIERSPDTVRRVVRNFEIHIPLAGVIDRSQEAERIRKSLAKLVQQRGALQIRLANRAFLERADPIVVREAKNQELDIAQRQEKLEQILRELSG